MKSFDFNKALLQINNDNIEFGKTNNTLENSYNKGIKNFENLKKGDNVYYNESTGFSIVGWNPVGKCILEAGVIDDRPRIIYTKQLLYEPIFQVHTKVDMELKGLYKDPYYNKDIIYNDNINGFENTQILLNAGSIAAKKCKEINELCYIPSITELQYYFIANSDFKYISEKIEKDNNDIYIWSSTKFNTLTTECIDYGRLKWDYFDNMVDISKQYIIPFIKL